MNLIIAIDENKESLKRIIHDLSGLRYRILGTSSIQRGLELVRMGLPDAILLSLESARQEDFRFLHELRNDEFTRSIPVLMHTTEPQKELVLRAREMGVFDLILSPWESDALRNRLNGIFIAQKTKAEKQQSETHDLKSVRAGGKMFHFIFVRITAELSAQIVRRTRKAAEEKSLDSVIFDIRAVPDFAGDGLYNFMAAINSIDTSKVVVAGRHYGELLVSSMDPGVRLFLSHDDLTLHFAKGELDNGKGSESHFLEESSLLISPS